MPTRLAADEYDGRTPFAVSGRPPGTVQRWVRAGVTTAFVVVPFAGLAAVWLAWGHCLNLADVLLAVAFYVITGLGVTVGFHRLLTHRSFTAVPALRVALAIAGSMSFEGEVIGWVAIHRRHHAVTDRPGDPHSPYRYGSSVAGQLRGLAHASVPSPERLAVPRTSLDRGTIAPAITRSRPGREFVRTAVSVAIAAAIFGFAVPRFAPYRSVLSSLGAMTWPQALLVGAGAAASMASAWFMICLVLPSIRLREAAVVNLGSTAVANTLPAGGALAMGVSWAMLSSWGISTADYVLYTMVSGIWNVFARLGLPVLALLVLMTASRPGAGLIVAAGAGLALLAAAAAGLGLLLRSESFAPRAGHALQRMAAVACRLARRPVPPDVAGWLPGFRGRTCALIAVRGWRITAAASP